MDQITKNFVADTIRAVRTSLGDKGHTVEKYSKQKGIPSLLAPF